ncbi:MAG: bifunctional DNA-binding transcriptional regulator/O6-methylguanine-DNA methyltransferase Ada [Pseudomonadota bacterium]
MQAVMDRDPGADGQFVYAVVTTGVFCKPSCPSRRPRPENVRFYPSAAAARAAGHRPCKRCAPEGRGGTTAHAALVARACRQIESAEMPPSLTELAAEARLSPFHFHRIFKATTGVTPKAYAAAHRAGRVREELAEGAPVTAALYEAGFGASSRFYETAAARLGMRPTAYRDGGRDVAIRFAVGECSLGSILVAATDQGVCAVQLGDDPAELVEALQDRFPNARLIGDDTAFAATVAAIVGLVERPHHPVELPLDVQGTAFQERVWQALRTIPPGDTASYAEIAERIGSPQAVRAVANACGANPVAVAIPCHRVVRSDGSLGGYRWGVERKQALLARERAR